MSAHVQTEARLERIEGAKALIRRYSYWSAGFGLIPLPFIDVVAITGTQVKMLMAIGKMYPAEVTEHHARAAIGALVGGVAPVAVGGTAISAFKMVPGLGQVVGVLMVPALAAASTVAVGRVFLEHFEAGGTLLDFDPEQMRAYYLRELEASKADPAAAVQAPILTPSSMPASTSTRRGYAQAEASAV